MYKICCANVGSETFPGDGPHVFFDVWMNGNPTLSGSRNTSGTFGPLQAQTSYIFTVRARDLAGQMSPISDPVMVTTEPANELDTPLPPALAI